MGREIIRESLGERDPKIARRKAAERNLFWEHEFAKAEASLPAKPTQLVLLSELSDAEFAEIVAAERSVKQRASIEG